MDDRAEDMPVRPTRLDDGRRVYSPPILVEYGSVAKLTQSNGSTVDEGSVIAKQKMCL
jgi:hypothetical protein